MVDNERSVVRSGRAVGPQPGGGDRDRDAEVLDYVERDVLQDRERIAWKGRPGGGRPLALRLFEFLFSIVWLGFAIFWTVTASANGGLFGLFGVPFIVIGVWALSRPLRENLRARRVYYAITDRRILIVTAGRRMRVNSITADAISDYERIDRGDGRGDIRLKKTVSRGHRGAIHFATEFDDGLWGVEDVKGAADAITALRTA